MSALVSIRQAGFTPGISPAGGLLIEPASRLTPEQRTFIRVHKVLLLKELWAELRAEQAAPEPSPPCCGNCAHSITPADTDPIYGWRLCGAGGFGGFARAEQRCEKWEARLVCWQLPAWRKSTAR